MSDWPVVPDSELMGGLGVSIVSTKIFKSLQWVFRQTSCTDIGIDGEIEIRNGDLTSHGRRIAVQIKCGSSYLTEENDKSYIYRGKYKHLRYWTEFSDPVIVILCNPTSEECWWSYVVPKKVNHHEKGWSLEVPKVNVLSDLSKRELQEIGNLYKKTDLIELLLRDWFGWSFQHKIHFVCDFAIPRDYHWLSMLGAIGDECIMIDYLMADFDGFPLIELEDMMKYAVSNSESFGYQRFILAFISESKQHFSEIPEPQNLQGMQIEFVPLLLDRRNLSLLEVDSEGCVIDIDNYEVEDADNNWIGPIKRAIKYNGSA